MKQTVKLVVKYILYGISLGCTFFVIMCLSYFVGGGEALLRPIFKDFARHSVGAMIVGIACGGTAVVYQFHRLSSLAQMIIHFCIGMGVFFPTAIYLGWIPFYPGRVIYTILQFLLSCGIFMAIWLCFYLFNRNEAKRINERLRELERDNTVNRD
ncbi:hypothetical protein C805_02966 [Eubacterium sp. 14-2]|uniref:DUF3021 domain-containing protein n=1 Tax=Eubacterium sp. 14-2 TaxID=1235790 RepID=UPI00033D804C|nr:DUF3021 domain-containing protein [Eubacterium sp. 14-2]EOT24753.1 hypothetical protein C805_02966 [Eubacterium sp. 14-2]